MSRARTGGQATRTVGQEMPLQDRVLAGLQRVNGRLHAANLPELSLSGQLIRPRLALAVASQPDAPRPGGRFWHAAAAVQMAHEASLIHDDIIDGAARRRGEPTAAARMGLAAALVQGDHLLTTAYRLAAMTRSGRFMALFARAVERTVAGEIRQGRASGKAGDWQDYRGILADKSGALLGAAWAAAPALRGGSGVSAHEEAGRRLGVAYQKLDDLLDYCPAVDSGKPALGDHRNRRWTWPLATLEGDAPWDAPLEEVLDALHRRRGGKASALEQGLGLFEREVAGVRRAAADLLQDPSDVEHLLDRWWRRAEQAVRAEAERRTSATSTTSTTSAGSRAHVSAPGLAEAAASGRPLVSYRKADPGRRWVLNRLAAASNGSASMARHARSFRFASALFAPAERKRVERLYAFCRFTDDLVDESSGDSALTRHRLNAWMELARRSYDGTPSGHGLLDGPMADAAEAGVPFRYAEELAAGMRMDLEVTQYDTLADLRVYTYRAAGVVGQWMTELFGVHDPIVLERAAALGHAMQLTNILRDVGEDLDRGRLYLPRRLLQGHGLDRDALENARDAGVLPAGYPAALEQLMATAEADYAVAFSALSALPPRVRRAVAVAARVYAGIHVEIRRNGYDNLRLRAHTGTARKLVLGAGALRDLLLLRQRPAPSGSQARAVLS